MKFIKLDRSFTLFSKSETVYLAMPRIWGNKVSNEFKWPDLHTYWRVVLLAEASSGKTAEFRNQTDKLNTDGKTAFYVRIEELAEQGFDMALEPAASRRFLHWCNGAEEGWFFLDSVDEARLNRKNFEGALKRFARELGQSLDRAHVYISCRVSDWKGDEDIAAIHRMLPIKISSPSEPLIADDPEPLLSPIFGPKKAKRTNEEKQDRHDPQKPLFVQIDPLSITQCQMLAESSGIENVAAFMKELTSNGLHGLAERPGDLLELVNYWKSYQHFGKLVQMIAHSIDQKLKERDDYRPDNDVLSATKAYEGAEKLAAALTFCKTFTIRTPGHGDDPELTSGALNPDAILVEWTDAERAALLRRGIFAPSTYGRVRFHQRSTQEYLAASWLNRLLNANYPRQEIWNCIFTEKYGIETVILSLRAEAAWLAMWQPDFRDEIIRREPMILLQHGDPRSLPIPIRARILTSYAAKHAAAEIVDDGTDRRALWLFADPELADAIRDAWRSNSRHDFKWNLLCLIREASITACADLGREVVLDASADDYNRIIALEALNACSDHEGLTAASQLLMDAFRTLDARLIPRFAAILFPTYLNINELLKLIAESKNTRLGEGFGHELLTLYDACPDTLTRIRFVAGLADLCLSPPLVADYQPISGQYQELASYLEPLARREIQFIGQQDPPDHLLRLIKVVEHAERQAIMPTDSELPLYVLMQQNWRIRRALFWSSMAEQMLNLSDDYRHVRFGRSSVHGLLLWHLGEEDLPWLYRDVAERDAHKDQFISLNAILWILKSTGKLTEETARLRELVKRDPALSINLDSCLKSAFALPIETEEERKHKNDYKRIERQRAENEAKAKASWVELRNQLQANPDQLRYLDASSDLAYHLLYSLTEWLSQKINLVHYKASKDWRLLAPVFGQDLAEAYRDGMKAIWRIIEPERPTHGPDGQTQTKVVIILSLGGIGIEAAEDSNWTANLSEQYAERAASHGICFEHDYPEWMDALIRSHSHTVLPILKQAVMQEWISPATYWPQLLNSFSDSTVPLQPLLQNLLLEVISGEEPADIDKLSNGLRIIKKLDLSNDQKTRLIAMLRERLAGHMAAQHDEYTLRYIALLLLLDINGVIDSLETWLENAPQDERKIRAEQGLSILFNRHDPFLNEALSEASVPTLERLLRLIYGYIRPEDDNVHDGVFTPDTRDNAQNARDRIFHTLLERPGAEAFNTMQRLASEPLCAIRSLRWCELAKKKAESDTEPPAWSADDIINLEQQQRMPVKTGSGLLRVVASVISNIQFQLTKGDASSRTLLARAENEEEVQNWIAEQLILRSGGRYQVYREAQVALRDKPDLIVSSVEAGCEVAIEVKNANMDWSFTQLEHALRQQLAEDYLKPPTRRHGILIISYHRSRSWEDPDTGKRNMTFIHVIQRLDAIAAQIFKNTSGPIEVKCMGIDASI